MDTESLQGTAERPRFSVSLFVSCLADLFRPSVAFNTIVLLEQAGCSVTVPTRQTCCAQPAYNSGDYEAAIPVAQQLIETFESADYVVVPSGSCAGMISHHYPKLLKGQWRQRAIDLSAKTYELSTFLSEVANFDISGIDGSSLPKIAYHDSCAGLRELGIAEAPRKLLADLCGSPTIDLAQGEQCCGFGGTFCAKMPALADKMVDDKIDAFLASGSEILAGGDLGCLMHIAGRAKRRGQAIEVRHIAELLALDVSGPAIGEGKS